MQFVVTGNRIFKDTEVVECVFDAIESNLVLNEMIIDVTVMDGASYGLDEIAHKATKKRRGWRSRRIPARWSAPCRTECNHGGRRINSRGKEYCPAQGDYRNQKMIDAGGHVFCIGFFAEEVKRNTGTYDCLTRAAKSGIPTFAVAKYSEWDIFSFPEGKRIGSAA